MAAEVEEEVEGMLVEDSRLVKEVDVVEAEGNKCFSLGKLI